jgi:hypothetical protein
MELGYITDVDRKSLTFLFKVVLVCGVNLTLKCEITGNRHNPKELSKMFLYGCRIFVSLL